MASLPTSGITMGMIASVLGLHAYPLLLSQLNTHPNINQWSKHKPIRAPHSETYPSGMTEDILRYHNYGFDVGGATYPIGTKGTDWNKLLGAARANNGQWKYLPPTGGTYSPYRMSDWKGYNPDAECPYYAVGYTSTTATVSLPTTINKVEGENVELPLEVFNLEYDIQTEDTFYLGIIYCSTGSPVSYAHMYVDTGQTLDDLNSDYTASIQLPITSGSSHNYDAIWVATQIPDPSDPEGSYDDLYTFWFPNTYVKLRYNPDDPGATVIILADQTVYPASAYSAGTFNFRTDPVGEVEGYTQDFWIEVDNSTSHVQYYEITVEMFSNLKDDPYSFNTETITGSIPAASYKRYSNGNGIHVQMEVPAGDTQELDSVGIRVSYRFSTTTPIPQSAQRRYINFTTNQITVTRPDPISFQNIINTGLYEVFINGTHQ